MLIQQQEQYKNENKQRKVEYEEILQELENKQEWQKLEHAELLQKLLEEQKHYCCKDVSRKTEQEQMVAKEIKSVQNNLQAEINTMRDAYTREFAQLPATQLRLQ